jgi:hypothetical protein
LAVLADLVKFRFNILRSIDILLLVLGESLSLGSVPVLVKSTLHIIGKMGGPNSGQCAKTVGGLNISNNTDNVHGWGLQDSNGLNSLLLVELRSRAFNFTDNMGHAGLVAHEGGKVARLARIIAREGTNPASVVLGPLLGEELKGTMAWLLKFTV